MLFFFLSYSWSVNSLFILDTLAATLISIVRSPISTTNPPSRSGLTYTPVSTHSLEPASLVSPKAHLGNDLELLALAVLGLGHGSFQALERLILEFLFIHACN